MATKAKSQKQILNSDVNNTAPDTDEVKTTKFVKSRRRTSFNEFVTVNNLRPEVKAGFKVWLKGQLFHFDDEWSKLFEEYKNR